MSVKQGILFYFKTKVMATAYQNLSSTTSTVFLTVQEVTVGIVVAEWNKHITEKAIGRCLQHSGKTWCKTGKYICETSTG